MPLKGKYEHTHTIVKFIQWLGCIVLFSIPAMASVALFSQPLSVNALKWIQFIQTVAFFLLPPLCVACLWSNRPLRWLNVWLPNSLSDMVWGMLLMLVALPAINLLGYLNQQMALPSFLEPLEAWMKNAEENARLLTEQFLNVTTINGLIINLLLMALLPAIAEELTFRGVLQRLFTPSISNSQILLPNDSFISQKGEIKGGVHVAIWCTAILFSAIHLQFYGFFPRMLMGALFGYMLVWTGSLWIPILMHFTNNAMAVVFYFVALRADWDMEKVDAIGTNDTLWLGVVSVILTILGICAFRFRIGYKGEI